LENKKNMASSHDTVSMAVFCDFENVALGVRDANYEKFDIKPVLERLLLKGSIVVKKAYCDWERYKGFKATMHEANFELIEIPHVRQSGKNSADIRLVVDALDLCYTKSHVNTFVIISGDSDFSPLVSKLRENAKQVIGVGVKQSTSDLLVANCDEFIFYDDLVRESRRAEAKRDERKAQPQPKRPATDESNRRKEELDARKTKAIDLAVETFDALVSERGDSGKIWASMLKEAIKRRKPDFSESYYGFRTFGNLLEEAQSRGLLEFGRDEKSGAYVYRSSAQVSAAVSAGPAGNDNLGVNLNDLPQADAVAEAPVQAEAPEPGSQAIEPGNQAVAPARQGADDGARRESSRRNGRGRKEPSAQPSGRQETAGRPAAAGRQGPSNRQATSGRRGQQAAPTPANDILADQAAFAAAQSARSEPEHGDDELLPVEAALASVETAAPVPAAPAQGGGNERRKTGRSRTGFRTPVVSTDNAVVDAVVPEPVIAAPEVVAASDAAETAGDGEGAVREPRRKGRGTRKPAAKKDSAPVVIEAAIEAPVVAAPPPVAEAVEATEAPAKPARKPAARGSRPPRKKAAE
jgi:uncharacterized LabA/DUF88 family protein